ncbi:Hypothetical predicted protein [Paramuricea clavata]|uniref:Uncharacterized protein n=1 Tax=Paramuricea clavata TaxID=317549 RepID=A0A6S7IU04_PARCT|nr:Hypothetical predicted protein [Paramuricea clavata]
MEGYSTILPSYTIPINTTTVTYNIFNTTNRTSHVINTTSSVITVIASSSAAIVVKGNSPNSSSGDFDMLFTWVFIACVVLALLMIISIFMVIVCWRVRRRRRTATVTDARKDAGKDRKRGRVNLRNSIKRVFISDGPLYAVSNLNTSRYSGLPEKQNNPNSDSARSSPSPEIAVSSDEPGNISKDNQHIIYQRYLSPVEGVPPPSASPVAKEGDDRTYLQPIDELRASKRFLQHSRNDSPEPEETYLEPLHGIPVPDEIHQKTSTPKPSPKPSPSPKPTVKPKP